MAQALINAKDHKELVHIAEGLGMLLKNKAKVTWHHEARHAGNPWNEFVDVAAKDACKEDHPTVIHNTPAEAWTNGQSRFATWAFLMRPSARQLIEYPKIIRTDRCTMTVAGAITPSLTGDAGTIASKSDQYKQAEEDRSKPRARTANLNILHYNVRSLNDENRMEKIAKQMAFTSTHIATFHESALKTNEAYVKHDYMICSSAATVKTAKGQRVGTDAKAGRLAGGCTTWISTALPFAEIDGIHQFIKLQYVSILVADSRRLIIRVKSPGASCIIMNLHAPDASGFTQDHISQWWHDTVGICDPIVGKDDVVICNAEANLRITNADCNANANAGTTNRVVGDILDLTPTVTPQERLTDFCKRFNLFIANTHNEIVDTNFGTGTWHVTNGYRTVRCDYGCLSNTVHVGRKSCYMDKAFNTYDDGRDHIPMRFVISFETQPRNAVAIRRQQKYNRQAVRQEIVSTDPIDVAHMAVVEARLKDLPPIPSGLDGSSHTHIIDTHIEEVMCDELPMPKSQPREDWISAATEKIFADRAVQWRTYSKTFLALKLSVITFVFRTWSTRIWMLPKRNECDANCVDREGKTGRWVNYPNEWRAVTGPIKPVSITENREAYSSLLSMHKLYRQSRSRDFVIMASRKAEMLIDATLNTDSRLTASLLRHMKPWQPRHQLRLMDLDQLPAGSYLQEKEIIQTHFCNMLEGKSTSMQSHIEDQRSQMVKRAVMNNNVRRQLSGVPSLSFIQKKNASINQYKAISDNRMGPDRHKAYPAVMAALYHPVHVKSALRIEETIQWKGSTLATLWKGKGSTTIIANHRELHIAPTDGKQYEASIRSNLIKPLAQVAGQFQYGAGLAGASCDMAHLHITEALAYGTQKYVHCRGFP